MGKRNYISEAESRFSNDLIKGKFNEYNIFCLLFLLNKNSIDGINDIDIWSNNQKMVISTKNDHWDLANYIYEYLIN